ncbi:hypothetical protein [Modestobacter sp. NPDC049651]|uniref:hypothetical protein n=1 Tax=unclassified Modestobacter TaxID=2643866 RepID=UPI00340A6691
MIAETALTLVAARSRPHGGVPAQWHAVEVHRSLAEMDGACELTVCGTLARVATEQDWPAEGDHVCPACLAATR